MSNQVPPPDPDDPDLPEGYQPPLVQGGLFVDLNWSPRLADRLGSVRTDTMVNEHWPRDLAPVFYPHLPNPFWLEVPEAPPVPEVPDLPVVVTITGVSPSTGNKGGSTGVTITGTGFIGVDPVTGVMFGSNPATGVIPDNPTQFTCLTPPGNGKVDVSVTGAAGTATLPRGFTYTSAPGLLSTQEEAQALPEPAEVEEVPGTVPEVPNGSPGTTEAPEIGQEPDMTEYEMDKLWGIELTEGSTSTPAEP